MWGCMPPHLIMATKTVLDYSKNSENIFATEDDKMICHTKQNIQPTLDYVKNLSEYKPGKEFRHVAEIPMVIYQQMVRDGSINDKKALKKWLNDPDNRLFRTWKGRI